MEYISDLKEFQRFVILTIYGRVNGIRIIDPNYNAVLLLPDKSIHFTQLDWDQIVFINERIDENGI